MKFCGHEVIIFRASYYGGFETSWLLSFLPLLGDTPKTENDVKSISQGYGASLNLIAVSLQHSTDVYKIDFLAQMLTVFRSEMCVLTVSCVFEVLKWSLESISGVFGYNLAFKML